MYSLKWNFSLYEFEILKVSCDLLIVKCNFFLSFHSLTIFFSVFNFGGYIVGIHIYVVHEIFGCGHAIHNNHIMENGVSITYVLFVLQTIQLHCSSYVKTYNKLLLTVVLLCCQILGLIHSF